MRGVILHRPAKEHSCLAGWSKEDSHYVHWGVFVAHGTVWQCECGQTWVAEPAPAYRNFVDLSTHWRKETWWEQRRRKNG